MCVKRPNGKGIKTRVDLVDLLLSLAQRFLLHNGVNIIARGSLADDASVARRIVEACAQNRHGSALRQVKVTDVLDRLGRNEGSVSREYKDVVIALQRFARANQRVSGSALRLLQNKIYAGMRNRLAHQFRFVADDGVDICGRN